MNGFVVLWLLVMRVVRIDVDEIISADVFMNEVLLLINKIIESVHLV
mgnify:CR=1 FL=1